MQRLSVQAVLAQTVRRSVDTSAPLQPLRHLQRRISSDVYGNAGNDDDDAAQLPRACAVSDVPRLTPNVRCAGHRTSPGHAADRRSRARSCRLLEVTACSVCQPACMTRHNGADEEVATLLRTCAANALANGRTTAMACVHEGL
jgi:hypothetical protein